MVPVHEFRSNGVYSSLRLLEECEFRVVFWTSRQKRLSVGPGEFRELAPWLDKKATVIICQHEDTYGSTDTYFSSLHHLLLLPEGQEALSGLVSVNIDLSYPFQKLDEGSQLFQLALIREGRRATGHSTSLWTPSPSGGLFAVDLAAFHQAPEVVGRSELPFSYRRRFWLLPEDVKIGVFDCLKGNRVTLPPKLMPELSTWISSLRRGGEIISEKSPERQQYLYFGSAMNRVEEGGVPRLPEFKAEIMRIWRLFVNMFPHSIAMLERIVMYSKYLDSTNF
jgi:hypothetical protein